MIGWYECWQFCIIDVTVHSHTDPNAYFNYETTATVVDVLNMSMSLKLLKLKKAAMSLHCL